MLFKSSQCSQSLACLPSPLFQVIFILYMCLCNACMLEALKGQKTACDSLEVELIDSMSQRVMWVLGV